MDVKRKEVECKKNQMCAARIRPLRALSQWYLSPLSLVAVPYIWSGTTLVAFDACLAGVVAVTSR